ncbi:MAG: hypothetical protein M1816_005338 [Peltula sp. TS41687]|nr:MAG: hypothetical protein M1816_005338 [Peltula sp. TS41687]
MEDHDEDLQSKPPSEAGSTCSLKNNDSSDEKNDYSELPEDEEISLEDVFSMIALDTDPTPHPLKSAPNLALGWQPPHDFTPPVADFETDDPDLMPRREEPMFGGDLFTPGWVRGNGRKLEGFCARGVGRILQSLPGLESFEEDEAGLELVQTLSDEGPKPIVVIEASEAGSSLINVAIDCIRKGDADAYQSLISAQPQIIQQQSSESKVLLHYAAESGSVDLVRHTLEVHATQNLAGKSWRGIDARSPKGMTPMMLAAGQGNYGVVEELLQAGADANVANVDGQTALDFAADAGYNSISELLVNHGADVKKSKIFHKIYMRPVKQSLREIDPDLKVSNLPKSLTAGWNDLMVSAYENDIAAVKRCLEAGSDIEATAPDGRTVLMISAGRGNKQVIEMLLIMGANIDATNDKGWTSLMIAVKNADHPTVRLLLSHGADVNHSSPDHWTALAEASQQGLTDIMQSLLACGADTESRSSHDWTPLMHACYTGNKRGVDLLLAAGANVENGSQRDESPMLLAAAAGHTEIVRTLISVGCLPESPWARKVEVGSESQRVPGQLERVYTLGWTPLMVACQGGHEEIVRLLLQAGANIEPKGPMEKTALEIAQENGRTIIVKILAFLERYNE